MVISTSGGRAMPVRAPQGRGEVLALVGDHHPLAGRIEMGQREVEARHRPAVGGAHLRHVVDEQIFGEMIGRRRRGEMLAGADEMPFAPAPRAQVLVHLGARRPRAAPVLPALERGEHIVEIAGRDAVDGEARQPVRRMLDPGVRHGFLPVFGSAHLPEYNVGAAPAGAILDIAWPSTLPRAGEGRGEGAVAS